MSLWAAVLISAAPEPLPAHGLALSEDEQDMHVEESFQAAVVVAHPTDLKHAAAFHGHGKSYGHKKGHKGGFFKKGGKKGSKGFKKKGGHHGFKKGHHGKHGKAVSFNFASKS